MLSARYSSSDDDSFHFRALPPLRSEALDQFSERTSRRREILHHNNGMRRRGNTVSRGFRLSDLRRLFSEIGISQSSAGKCSHEFCRLLDTGLEPSEALQKVIFGPSISSISMRARSIGVGTLGLAYSCPVRNRVICLGRIEPASSLFTYCESPQSVAISSTMGSICGTGFPSSRHEANWAAHSSSCGSAPYDFHVPNWAAGASSSHTPCCGPASTSTTSASFPSFTTCGFSSSTTPGDPFVTTGTFDATNDVSSSSGCINCSNGDHAAEAVPQEMARETVAEPHQLQQLQANWAAHSSSCGSALDAFRVPNWAAGASSSRTPCCGPASTSTSSASFPSFTTGGFSSRPTPGDPFVSTGTFDATNAVSSSSGCINCSNGDHAAEAVPQEMARQTVAEPHQLQKLQKFLFGLVDSAAVQLAVCIVMGYKFFRPPPNQIFNFYNSTLNNNNDFAFFSAFKGVNGKIQSAISLIGKTLFGGKSGINAIC